MKKYIFIYFQIFFNLSQFSVLSKHLSLEIGIFKSIMIFIVQQILKNSLLKIEQIIVIQKVNKKMRMHSLSQYQSRISDQTRRASGYSQLVSTPTSNSTQINSIIECPICSNSIKQAHMCPSCCKMFCQGCIKNYLKTKKLECPSCLKNLNDGSLLNCSILGRQIQQALSKSVSKVKSPPLSTIGLISPSNNKIMFPKTQPSPIFESPIQTNNSQIVCQKHQLKLDYYCETCKQGLCSDCAVLSTNHQGHRLCRISHKKLKFKELISKLQKDTIAFKTKIIGSRQQALQALQKIKLAQHEKQTILINYLNHLFRITCEKHQQISKEKESFLFQFRDSYLSLENHFSLLEKAIKQSSKSHLIKNSQQLSKQIGQLIHIQIDQNMHLPIISKIQSQIVPQYEQKTYILANYSQLRQKGDILISQPLFHKGTEWRLKIFPGGIDFAANKGLDQYLAIHLQMTKGNLQTNWYKYRVQLVNQINRSKCMSFEFQNDFKQGSEWGLDNFIKISSLYTENFIHPSEGYIQIILYVRCLSYFHGVRDQKQLIKIKQCQLNDNYHKIINLRKKAVQLGLNSEFLTEISSSGRMSTRNSKQNLSNSGKSSQIRRVMAIDAND